MYARQLLGFAIALSVASLASAQEVALPIRDGDRVVLLGGGLISGERDFGYLEARLSRSLPDANIVFRNLGWPGDNVRGLARTGGFKNPDGFNRLVKEVAELKPTIVIIGYGMNESFDGPEGLAGFHKDYRQLLAQLAPLKARIVLLSPTCHEDLGPPWPNATQHNLDLEQYTAIVEKIAGEEKSHFVDLFHPLALAFKKDPKIRWTTNGIQLNGYGYAQAARIVEAKLGLKHFPDLLEIDAAEVAPQQGRVIDQIKASPDGFRCRVSDSLLAVPGDSPTLRVKGLKTGKYRIRIDGKDTQQASEVELSMGTVMPTDAPPLAAGVDLCRKIAYKNDLFYRRWRPFNDHSRHWGFIGGDFQLWEKQVADQEKIIAQSRRPRDYVVEIVREP